LGSADAHLDESERRLLRELREWRGPEAVLSNRASAGVGGFPNRIVQAAVAATTGFVRAAAAGSSGLLADASVDRSALLFDVRNAGPTDPGSGSSSLPRSFAKLRLEPDWESGILPAIKSEIGGLIQSNVYEEIPWEPRMSGILIRTHRLDERRPDKCKSRFVAEGNHTVGDGVHFDEVATSMASATAVKMVVSFAAGCRSGLFSLDFRQAFLQADVANPNLLIELPDLPYEMMTGEFGSGKRDRSGARSGMVGRLKKALYGLRDSPRLWAKHLQRFLTEEVGVRILVADRNVFKWEWNGETLLAACHVDDVLFTPSGPGIHAEFLRRIRARFEITGGDVPVSKFCGYQFRYDQEAQTIEMHQEDFARAVLRKYGAVDVKPVDTPMKVGAPPLEPWDGTASDRETLEFAMFLGDLTWLTRCNPRLSFVAQDLAQFSHNPGPKNELYPHRHTMLVMCDSGFSHKGCKAVTCVSVLMNGAVVHHVSRRQSTVSMTSTEAEVKAAAMAAEVIASVVPLWSEIAGAMHPPVRVCIDNKGAKKQCESGTDTVASAPYLRCKSYCESKIYEGLLWLDLVPGEQNGADMGTKQIRDTSEFIRKDGLLSGRVPSMFPSAEVLHIQHRMAISR
jgi:hypothetical protein